ncbi:small T antigen [New Jersey polyomavirus-2013]|uniref:Small T antigen n=1 Tax=New Jersey polyomavirus-2013 TaxID=1497391 RepID=A0A024B5E8_9POLY|nr:small T antigen [New Jersey polyomavirus-2013]AHZ11648.1 small T antigen [New Jersey polyomavirus-2013]
MEKVLEKSDKEMLIELLGIPRYAYGNFPIMKTAYKRASKIYHPDKGGSSEKMMLLNSLWQKFQEGLIEVRDSEVCQVSFSDCYDSSLLKCCSPKVFHELFLRSPQCLLKGPTSCSCITSCLYNQHRQIKLCGKKRCLTWGNCFCFSCFILWFGLRETWKTFEIWKHVIAQMPAALLQLSPSLF